jgi:hypothetical protein
MDEVGEGDQSDEEPKKYRLLINLPPLAAIILK